MAAPIRTCIGCRQRDAAAEMVRLGYQLHTYEAQTAILGTPEELHLFLMAAAVAGDL